MYNNCHFIQKTTNKQIVNSITILVNSKKNTEIALDTVFTVQSFRAVQIPTLVFYMSNLIRVCTVSSDCLPE